MSTEPKLARVIRLDESDVNVFDPVAEPGEWAVSGAFAFSDWSEADLVGKARQAFANGWLGLSSFGRATFVAVAPVTQEELEAATRALAQHFVERWGAPSLEAAWPVAEGEIADMRAMCEDHDTNTLLVVERELVEAGVRERIRVIVPEAADLVAFAVHGDRGD
ncbi:hypothetical protein SAMN05216257_10521 [Meinhardsimonia xiamenensis]|jgi:hypothetical protein|uniref:Uncharacterized protein n=1 Tax=Meinhardsimonia xiamenensis TaxID=990712 RepID=A0A1G9F3Y4_9RHOB|nr:DUF6505 family protein [Meinhardsimonia xiamenensis]PRX38008.1 hypothetical protein LV81_00281 [Meinhardsimonia xiamenensis]SDK83071.1 hypothetical protein SAMN05216257_10521 [Meinhardsimonia xiamenensis]